MGKLIKHLGTSTRTKKVSGFEGFGGALSPKAFNLEAVRRPQAHAKPPVTTLTKFNTLKPSTKTLNPKPEPSRVSAMCKGFRV